MLKLRFRIGDPDLPERRKRYTSRPDEEEMHRDVPLWQSIRVEFTWWENVKYTRRNGMC